MNAANADKRDVAFKKHQQILFAVSNSNGASTAGSLHPDVSFNYELMAVGDIGTFHLSSLSSLSYS